MTIRNREIREVLRYAGLLGHTYVVVEAYAKDNGDQEYETGWRTSVETSSLARARAEAKQRPGSRIYGKTKPLPNGGKGWERYPKTRGRT